MGQDPVIQFYTRRIWEDKAIRNLSSVPDKQRCYSGLACGSRVQSCFVIQCIVLETRKSKQCSEQNLHPLKKSLLVI
jgi:hypothetical protein